MDLSADFLKQNNTNTRWNVCLSWYEFM